VEGREITPIHLDNETPASTIRQSPLFCQYSLEDDHSIQYMPLRDVVNALCLVLTVLTDEIVMQCRSACGDGSQAFPRPAPVSCQKVSKAARTEQPKAALPTPSPPGVPGACGEGWGCPYGCGPGQGGVGESRRTRLLSRGSGWVAGAG